MRAASTRCAHLHAEPRHALEHARHRQPPLARAVGTVHCAPRRRHNVKRTLLRVRRVERQRRAVAEEKVLEGGQRATAGAGAAHGQRKVARVRL
jgi:hypothetical protein